MPETTPPALETASPEQISWPTTSERRFCSFNECPAGHRWPPTLTTIACPGCSSAVLAIQKTNCPFCNEPTVRTMVRSDFVPKGAGLAPRCAGGKVQGETLDIELVRHEWREVESTPFDLFEAKQAAERAAAVPAQTLSELKEWDGTGIKQ